MLRELGSEIARMPAAGTFQMTQPFEAVERRGISSARRLAIKDRSLADFQNLTRKAETAAKIGVRLFEARGTGIVGLDLDAIWDLAVKAHPIEGASPKLLGDGLQRAGKCDLRSFGDERLA